MANSVYKINKGINRPIEFRGLKAQYIVYLAIGLVALLLLFAIMYISGLTMYVCLPVTAALGAALFAAVYRLSDHYGQHGLMKVLAARSIPKCIQVRSRKIFINLQTDLHGERNRHRENISNL